MDVCGGLLELWIGFVWYLGTRIGACWLGRAWIGWWFVVMREEMAGDEPMVVAPAGWAVPRQDC